MNNTHTKRAYRSKPMDWIKLVYPDCKSGRFEDTEMFEHLSNLAAIQSVWTRWLSFDATREDLKRNAPALQSIANSYKRAARYFEEIAERGGGK